MKTRLLKAIGSTLVRLAIGLAVCVIIGLLMPYSMFVFLTLSVILIVAAIVGMVFDFCWQKYKEE